MHSRKIVVKAEWDEEAEVWTVTESDVPGLVVEAATAEELKDKVLALVPELVELNRHLLDWAVEDEMPIHLMTEQLQRVRLGG